MGLDSFTGVSYSPRVRSFGGKLFVYSEDGIAVSADDGLTFIMINQALSDSTGTPMGTQHLASDGTRVAVIAGGSVWYSPDLGASWTEIVDNLPYSSFSFENMAMHDGYLYISLNHAEAPLWRRLFDKVVPLSGYVWRDDNNNGQPDPGEPPYPGAFLHAGSALFATSGTDGTFEMLGDLNAGAVEIALPYSWVIPNPASQPFTDSSAGLNFGLYFPPDVVDLSVNQTNFTVFRPGFNETISLTYQNHGIAPADAVLRFVPADPLQLVNANPAPDAISGDTLVWNLSSIPGFGSGQVLVKVHTPVATAIGSSVTTWASITPTQADAIPVDNEHVLTEAVVGSYDPNDKRSNRERISPDELTAGEPILYTIRFQNTGNFPADFVRITDTLDFSKLDISSFRVLATSHPCQTTLSGAGNLEFFFGNIQLPPESQDEPGSHGFVQFQIRPKAGLPLGATLRNKAYIYFDFNAPVLTNTAETVVAWPLAAFQPTKADALLISPNPAINVARIELPAASGLLRVFDATGRLVMQQTAEDRTIRIDLAGLAAGVYAVEWSGNQAGHRRIGRLVKL